MVLKNLRLFQWRPTIDRVTLAHIDNKHNKMKETEAKQGVPDIY